MTETIILRRSEIVKAHRLSFVNNTFNNTFTKDFTKLTIKIHFTSFSEIIDHFFKNIWQNLFQNNTTFLKKLFDPFFNILSHKFIQSYTLSVRLNKSLQNASYLIKMDFFSLKIMGYVAKIATKNFNNFQKPPYIIK